MLRLCVTGSGGVGKSSLTIRYLRDEFTEYYDPTLEETYQKEIEYAGRLYDIEIVDTAGQEEFSSFRDSSLATGDAFLILFAINSQASWLEMKDLRSKIIEDKEQPSLPMIIVGNKRDLEDEREVDSDEIQEYCNTVSIPYIETSAKTGLNVQEAFQLIYGQIHRLQAHMLERTLSRRPAKSKKKDCLIV
ncbi:ras-like protein rasD [Dendronephthya gigantea]|uniref:ras-like protein rasD n=1 Tax=Dendronephthya gigantea TaxID=151771 RepID=UPI00106A15DA|nr:ras-like protein rasD [Dendronephthya gigantea]